MRSCEFRFLCVVSVCLLMSAPIIAQVLYGTLDGTITDASGGTVSGAVVTVTHTGTGLTREILSNSTGSYSAPNLEPGTYNIRVSKPGFQSFTATGVRVAVNTAVRVNAQMQVGQVTETLTVAAQPNALQTERADVRYEMDSKSLEDLPVPIGRNFQGLLRVLPGFSVSGGGAIRASNPAAAFTLNVNGTSAQVNNTRIDGASHRNGREPRT